MERVVGWNTASIHFWTGALSLVNLHDGELGHPIYRSDARL
jgi:hypothetical protein